MKVFLVWSGDYEQRGISEIFSSLENAQRFVEESQADGWDIEEHEVKQTATKWLTIHEAVWSTSLGERVSSWWGTEKWLGEEEAEEDKHRYFYGVEVRATTEAQAVLRMQELRTAWMKRRGLTEIPERDPRMRSIWRESPRPNLFSQML